MAVMNTESERPAGPRSRYPKEFRRDAAALVIDQHRTVVDVAKELGVVEQTLSNWVRQERIDRGQKGHHEHRSRRDRPAEPLEQAAASGTRPVEKSNGHLGEGVRPVTKYRWITARKAEGFPVRLCCRALQMAPSSYYDWFQVHGAGGLLPATVASNT